MGKRIKNLLAIDPPMLDERRGISEDPTSLKWQTKGVEPIVLQNGNYAAALPLSRNETRYLIKTDRTNGFVATGPDTLEPESTETHYQLKSMSASLFRLTDGYRSWFKAAVKLLGGQISDFVSQAESGFDAILVRSDNIIDILAAISSNAAPEVSPLPIILEAGEPLFDRLADARWLTGLEIYTSFGEGFMPSNTGISNQAYEALSREFAEIIIGEKAWRYVQKTLWIQTNGTFEIFSELMPYLGVILLDSDWHRIHFNQIFDGTPESLGLAVEDAGVRHGSNDYEIDNLRGNALNRALERIAHKPPKKPTKTMVDYLIGIHARIARLNPESVRRDIFKISEIDQPKETENLRKLVAEIAYDDLRDAEWTHHIREINRYLGKKGRVERTR